MIGDFIEAYIEIRAGNFPAVGYVNVYQNEVFILRENLELRDVNFGIPLRIPV